MDMVLLHIEILNIFKEDHYKKNKVLETRLDTQS